MTVATGHSLDLDSVDAIAEALDQCAEGLGGRAPRAGLLYAGIDHDHQALLDGIEARHPGLPLIGCTTHGELSSDGFAEDSVVLMLFHSDRVQFRAGVGERTRTNPEAARQAARMALDGLAAPVQLCVVLPEGLGGGEADAPGTLPADLLASLSEALGADVPVCGGLAGDQFRFTGTAQFCNGRVYSDAVPVLLLAGPLRVATGVASGWAPMGDDHRVTAADGLVIAEIGGESPREVWTRYLGTPDLLGSRNYLAVHPDRGGASDEFYVCAPSHFLEDGRMVTMSPVPQGARIRFADATRDEVLAGAARSVQSARAGYPGTPDAALVFSCAGRHTVLGMRVGVEVDRLREQVQADVPAIGFYAYGEICPLAASPAPVHHNSTFVTVLIGEDP